MASELLPWETGTGRRVFVPDFGHWGHQSLRERPVPGLSEGKVPAETPKACVPFLLPPHPLDKSQFLQPHSVEGAFIHRWGDPKEGAGGGNPTTRRHGARGAFQSSSSPEAPRPLGAVGVVPLQEDPLDLEVVGPCRGEQARQVHGAGIIAWHILPSSVSPMTVHPSEPSLPRLQGCASSPGHQGPRGIESAFSFCDLYFILVYR